MVAGIILVFIPATGQFVMPDLLGGAKTVMLGNAIQQQFGSSRDWPFGSAIAFVGMAIVLAGLCAPVALAGKPGRGGAAVKRDLRCRCGWSRSRSTCSSTRRSRW